MRFTRPGARPCHSDLDSAQLRGGVLGAGVEDESARAQLGAGEVLQLVLGAVGWIELDVEVVVLRTPTRRSLVHGHHVRERFVEQAVVLLEQCLQVARKGVIVSVVEIEQPASVVDWGEVDLVRPACEWRYERDPPLVADHGAHSVLLAGDHLAVEAATGLAHVPGLRSELTLENRRKERVGVDLSVRVAQGDAYLLPAVLEDVDVTNAGQAPQLSGPVAPTLDQVADVIDALLAQRRVMDLRVTDDFGAPLVTCV